MIMNGGDESDSLYWENDDEALNLARKVLNHEVPNYSYENCMKHKTRNSQSSAELVKSLNTKDRKFGQVLDKNEKFGQITKGNTSKMVVKVTANSDEENITPNIPSNKTMKSQSRVDTGIKGKTSPKDSSKKRKSMGKSSDYVPTLTPKEAGQKLEERIKLICESVEDFNSNLDNDLSKFDDKFDIEASVTNSSIFLRNETLNGMFELVDMIDETTKQGLRDCLLDLTPFLLSTCRKSIFFTAEKLFEKTNAQTSEVAKMEYSKFIDRALSGLNSSILLMKIVVHTNGKIQTDLEWISSLIELWKAQINDSLLLLLGFESHSSKKAINQEKQDLFLHLLQESEIQHKLSCLCLFASKLLDAMAESMRKHHNIWNEEAAISLCYASLIPFIGGFYPSEYLMNDDNGLSMAKSMQGLKASLDYIQNSSMGILSLIFCEFQTCRMAILDELVTGLSKLPVIHLAIKTQSTPNTHVDVKSDQNSYGIGWGRQSNLKNLSNALQLPWSSYRLENGTVMHSATALLCRLLESLCVWSDRGKALNDHVSEQDPEKKLEEELDVALRNYGAAKQYCAYVIRYLLQRATSATVSSIKSKTKSADNDVAQSISVEYRMIIDGIVGDCLNALGSSALPSAVLVLETTAAALLEVFENDGPKWNPSVSESSKFLLQVKLFSAELLSWVSARCRFLHLNSMLLVESSSDENIKIAMDYSITRENQFLDGMINSVVSLSKSNGNAGLQNYLNRFLLHHLNENHLEILKNLKASNADLNTSTESKLIYQVALQLSQLFSVYFSEKVILLTLQLTADGSPSVRSKSMRLITFMSLSDPDMMKSPTLKEEISAGLMDNSSSVRDATMELISIYSNANPREAIEYYYDLISIRILDSGVNVRKRVIRLLKTLYDHMNPEENNDSQKMIDCCVKLIKRSVSVIEENTVKDLAFKTLIDLLFSPLEELESAIDIEFNMGHEEIYLNLEPLTLGSIGVDTRTAVAARLKIFSGIVEEDSIPSAYLMKFMELLCSKAPSRMQTQIIILLKLMVDMYMEDAMAEKSLDRRFLLFESVSFIAHSFPSLFVKHITSFKQPFMEAATNANSKRGALLLVSLSEMFQNTLPLFSKTSGTKKNNVFTCGNKILDPKFVYEFEKMIVSMVLKLPSPLVGPLVECLSVIVSKVTHNYYVIAHLCHSCTQYMETQKTLLNSSELPQEKTIASLVRAISLIGFICQSFDLLANKNCFYISKNQLSNSPIKDPRFLERFTDGSIVDDIYELLILYAKYDYSTGNMHVLPIISAAIMALGGFWTKNTNYIIKAESTETLNLILLINDTNKSTMDLQAQTIRALNNFLMVEDKKIFERLEKSNDNEGAADKKPSLSELKGQSEDLAEAGISSSLMQHFLPRILELLLVNHIALQAEAFKVVKAAIDQGLVHPLICMPALIALSSVPGILQNQAVSLHEELNEKYSSFIHSNDLEGLLLAYKVRKLLEMEDKRGFISSPSEDGIGEVATSAFQNLFNIVRDKRPKRKELMNVMSRAFSSDWQSQNITEHDVGYLKFLSEAITSLEFKTLEEPIIVVHNLNKVLSTIGADIHSSIKLLNLNDLSSLSSKDVVSSIVISIIAQLKLHLQAMYNINDLKCDNYKPNEFSKALDKVPIRHLHEPIAWHEISCLNNEEDFRELMDKSDQTLIKQFIDQFLSLMETMEVLSNENGNAIPYYAESPNMTMGKPSLNVKLKPTTPTTGSNLSEKKRMRAKRRSTASGKSPHISQKKRQKKRKSAKYSSEDDDSTTDTSVTETDLLHPPIKRRKPSRRSATKLESYAESSESDF